MRQGTTTSIRWAAIAAAVALAVAASGCGGAIGTSAATPADSKAAADSSGTGTVQTRAIDPAVAHWARAWKRKVEVPMERATARLAATIDAAIAGNSTAAYRLTHPLDVLSNCRNPLDLGLAQTPPELAAARRRTLSACREIYVGTNEFVAGLNSLSPARANAGLARIWHGVARLRRTAQMVKRAAQPE